MLLSLKFSLTPLLLLSLDNNFAYDTTISGIRRCWVLALETVIVAEGHVLLWRQHLILFHVLHVVGVRQAAYVVIWWICKIAYRKEEGKLFKLVFNALSLASNLRLMRKQLKTKTSKYKKKQRVKKQQSKIVFVFQKWNKHTHNELNVGRKEATTECMCVCVWMSVLG